MTYEQYDRAIKIHDDMNAIYALQDVLKNSNNGKFLSAIKAEKMDSSGRIIDFDVLNHAKVPAYIMEKFEKILWEELDALKTEFNKL